MNRLSRRIVFRRNFFIIILIVLSVVCLIFDNLIFLCLVLSFLQRMGRLMLVCIVLLLIMRITWRFSSFSLLRHRALISIMKRLCFLQVKSSWLLWNFFFVNINIIIICVSSIHLIRHIKPAKVWRNKLSACYIRTALFVLSYSWMKFRIRSELTGFHLSQSFCFFFNSRSGIIYLRFMLLCIMHWVWRLVLHFFFFNFFILSIFAFDLFSNFWWSFTGFCTSSLSGMTSPWLWICSVCLLMFLNQFFNVCFSYTIKVWVCKSFYCSNSVFRV